MSWDFDAQQSSLPAMAACLGMGDLAGAMRTTPRASPPPAPLAAPPVIAVCDASGIETAGGDVEGVAQRAPTSLPSRTADKTVQTVEAASGARIGTAVCMDGCAVGTCGETHVRTFVPAVILAATAPAVANPYVNANTGTAVDTGGGVDVQPFVPAAILAATALAVATPI